MVYFFCLYDLMFAACLCCYEVLKIRMIHDDCDSMLHDFQVLTLDCHTSGNGKHLLGINIVLPLGFINHVRQGCNWVECFAAEQGTNL